MYCGELKFSVNYNSITTVHLFITNDNSDGMYSLMDALMDALISHDRKL